MSSDTPANTLAIPCTGFAGARKIASGSLADVALALNPLAETAKDPLLIFADDTGTVLDIDLRGSTADMLYRLTRYQAPQPPQAPAAAKPRGRPKLGVIAREVTLLPRHWDWLAAQPGGASQALRRLVDQARKADGGQTARRLAHERAYRVMAALAGDYPGFEDAARALFADDIDALARAAASWPQDVRDYAVKLAQPQDQSRE